MAGYVSWRRNPVRIRGGSATVRVAHAAFSQILVTGHPKMRGENPE
jgi:hypothetical protein